MKLCINQAALHHTESSPQYITVWKHSGVFSMHTTYISLMETSQQSFVILGSGSRFVRLHILETREEKCLHQCSCGHEEQGLNSVISGQPVQPPEPQLHGGYSFLRVGPYIFTSPERSALSGRLVNVSRFSEEEFDHEG
ncbi:unnamed protein product [Pleuronectes platessa]|uniref:Uncharacterized protein n=1 Tax=Pleuronectes platessa TaxID=8262 RepID=A0A9N7Y8S5_PLEPL|nr:unnamed protein product [Pleuronectes platessa]